MVSAIYAPPIPQHDNLTDVEIDETTAASRSFSLSSANLVSADPSSSQGGRARGWICGTATLSSIDGCQVGCEAFLGTRVKFEYCAIGNTGIRLTRTAQAFFQYAELVAINSPKLISPDIPGCFIASFNTRNGYWIIQSQGETSRSLVHWLDSLRERRGQSPDLYRDVVEACVQIIHCVKRIQDKGVNIALCRPDKFVISPSLHVDLVDSNDLYLSPTFKPLFPDKSIRSAPLPLNDIYISHNLRFLSPETVTSRCLSKSNLVYSLGVLLYEVVTGIRIAKDVALSKEVDILADIHRHIMESPIDPIKTASLPLSLNDVIMLCLAKDVGIRYLNLDSLLYDLRHCLDDDNFQAGRMDRLARFNTSAAPLHREDTIIDIDNALSRGSHINVWGFSGSGKSHIVNYWASLQSDRFALQGFAKLDDHMARPLPSFSQIFESLLDQIFSDPKQDPKVWLSKIQETLHTQYPLFVALLSQEYRNILVQDFDPGQNLVDWDNILAGFALWSKRLIQLFATHDKPLLLIIDDIQWLRTQEIDLWRAMFDGNDPLQNVRCITMYRIEQGGQPGSDALLSASAVQTQIRFFSLDAVKIFLDTCYHGRLADSLDLATILFKQTGGNPLFVRARVNEIFTSGLTRFDYSTEQWVHDIGSLDKDQGNMDISAYLDEVLLGLDEQAQRMLLFLSCLPSSGFDVVLLADLLGRESSEVLEVIESISSLHIVEMKHGTVKFSHDQKQAAASRLKPECAAKTHQRVADYLLGSALRTDFFFEGVDQAVLAQKTRQSTADAKLIVFVLDAAERAALAAGFALAHGYLQTAESYLESYDSTQADYEDLYFRLSSLSADVCGALKMTAERTQWLVKMKAHCRSLADQLVWATLSIRKLFGELRNAEAADIALSMLEQCGYDIEDPIPPLTVSEVDVEAVWASWEDVPNLPRSDTAALIDLLSFAGASVFLGRKNVASQFASLALKIVFQFPYIHAGTGHLLGLYCLMNPTSISLHRKLIELAWRTTCARPLSPHAGGGWNVCAALAHGWIPLDDLSARFEAAYRHSSTYGISAMFTYVMMMDLSARNFSPRPFDTKAVLAQYRQFPSDASAGVRSLVHICLQYAENARCMVETQPAWTMDGQIFAAGEIDLYRASPLHDFVWHVSQLRLAVFYGAPLDELKKFVDEMRPRESQAQGLSPSLEWIFLESVIRIKLGKQPREHINRLIACEYYVFRVKVLNVLVDLYAGATKDRIDALLDLLDQNEQHELAGLLSFCVGEQILETAKNSRHAAGYINAACRSYVASGSIGFAKRICRDYPSMCQPIPAAKSILGEFMPLMDKPPQIRRQESSNAQEDSSSYESELDAVTLVRTSLLLMEEKDPVVLLCKLLQLICQNTRADYAAIAINDEHDVETLRLRAAGRHDNIMAYDVSIKADACKPLCPTTYMVQVARTGRPLIVSAFDEQTRSDPFFKETPKSCICLPILTQGLRSGVVFLSSSFLINAEFASAQDIIACLGTYGLIVTRLHSYIERLDLQAQQLRQALEAKTNFLSHCSHELRTPLSAILGMTTVLEATPGLSVVQKEHLNLIQSSGQDLLTLISDILDQTRLDHQAVTLNPSPFALRSLIEDILQSLASVAQNKGLEISLLNDLSTDPPIVIADAFRVKQVILNLLSNAIKFTQHGKVTIAWRWEDTDKGMIVWLDVEDSGVGIPQDQMHRLFGTFSQLTPFMRRAYGGSGLGLSIARSLSRLLGGDCTAQSVVNQGSTFTFSFKCDKGSDSRLEPLKTPLRCVIPGAETHGTLKADLQYLGCHVDIASRGHIQPSDVIFLDEEAELDILEQIPARTKIFVLAKSIAVTEAILRFGLPRDSIISLPIKSHLLHQALIDSKAIRRETQKAKTKTTRTENLIASEYPLDILLVDDNPINIKVGKRLLAIMGYEKVDTVFDGQQAIDQFGRKRYHVILLDLQMPVLDGYAAHQQILKRYGLPEAGGPCVVAVSANADQETQRICRESNFFSYLSKPIDLGRLTSILKDAYKVQSDASQKIDGPE